MANTLAGSNGILEVMPLGDSITRGENAISAQPVQDGYRDDLGNLLNSADIDFNFVGSLKNGSGFDNDHEGHGGKTIGFLSDNIGRWLSSNPAEVVLLKVGSNDMGFFAEQSPTRAVSQLSDLIDKISNRVPNAEILVSSIAPVNPENLPNASFGPDVVPDFQARVEAFNSLLPDLVSTKAGQGQAVSFVDVNSALSQTRDISIDGLHPNDGGYARIASTYFSAIQEIIDAPVAAISAVNEDESSNYLLGTASNDEIEGSAGDDILVGFDGDDAIKGGIGDDTLYGINGDDTLIGGNGSDLLLGGEGNDILEGMGKASSRSPQIDTLYGGDGSDIYVVQSLREPAAYAGYDNFDYVKIEDFDRSRDKIALGSSRYRIADADGGAGIFNSNGELLAVVGGYSAQSLNINDTSNFVRNYA